MELRGKSFGGLAAAGVGESVYGVCEEPEPGSKGGPGAPQPLHTLHTDPLLFRLHGLHNELHGLHNALHDAQFCFNHRTVFALSCQRSV